MDKLKKIVTYTLLLTFVATSIYGQEPYDTQEDEPDCSAYKQSSHAAHWSVYVPITIIVVAAICFGLADRSHEHHDSSKDSQDGLGSIDSSKRHSNNQSGGYHHHRHHKNRGGYSH